MGLEHSWKWLPPRFKGGSVKGSGRSRACLPPLQQLDERLLLSTAPGPTGGGDQAIIAVLIGLLRNEINVRGSELDALKIAAGAVDTSDKLDKQDRVFLKLQTEFMKLDAVLDKVSVDAVNGGVSTQKVREATLKINEIFTDIGTLLPYLSGKNTDGKGALLPAVQKVHEAATAALDAATKVTKIKPDNKVLEGYLKTENELLKIDAQVMKYSFLELKLGQDSDKLTGLKVHIAASFDKLDADIKLMGDGSVFKGLSDDLATLKIDTLGFLSALPAVQTPGTVGDSVFAGLSLKALGDLIIE